jgi:hypothetical protein
MAKTFKVSPALDDKNLARLQTKTYAKTYTPIPNRALPEVYREALSAIYTGITGEEFPEDGNTFLIRAETNGVFKRLYAPMVVSTEEGGLIIRWGSESIPLVLSAGKISTANAAKGVKFSFKEEQIGKYKEPTLNIAINSGGTLFSFPIPIRSASFEDKLSVEILDMVLDENPAGLAEMIALAPSSNTESTGERMIGEFLKVAQLPLDDYEVTTYRTKEGGQYGTDYYLQVRVKEPFVAMVSNKVGEEWVQEEREIRDWAIVRPNTALKKLLAAEPVITPEDPATLMVLEHFEYNGNPAAKVALRCEAFSNSPDSFNIDF